MIHIYIKCIYKTRSFILLNPCSSAIDRLVEDLILESMSKGDFDNLPGKGKPLTYNNHTPMIDIATHNPMIEIANHNPMIDIANHNPMIDIATHNPMIDIATHNLNRILLENGYKPEWVLLDKEIRYLEQYFWWILFNNLQQCNYFLEAYHIVNSGWCIKAEFSNHHTNLMIMVDSCIHH